MTSYIFNQKRLLIVINSLPFFFSLKVDSENMERLLTKKINIYITKYNNRFYFDIKYYDKEECVNIDHFSLTIPKGRYEIQELNEILQTLLKENGHENYITLQKISSKDIVLAINKPNCEVIFKGDTFNDVLGFSYNKPYGLGGYII